ncbi:hypothetical protein B0O99DRAFT_602574 [Bisporella sp. PMI_857]|nr:hypothetical protein B0O99DRAFT_602574 [Bisporella sp. PMI_857]
MVESLLITSPSALADITTKLPTSDLSASSLPPATLVLLQPLANPNTLAECRSSSNHIHLNLQPLSLAWRQAMIKTQPFADIIFDLRLPKQDGDDDFYAEGERRKEAQEVEYIQTAHGTQAVVHAQPLPTVQQVPGELKRICWDTDAVRLGEGGFVIKTKDVLSLVITIATGVRMRAEGGVRFRVVWEERESVSVPAVRLLEKQLRGLEKEYKKTTRTTVEGGEDSCERRMEGNAGFGVEISVPEAEHSLE